MSYAHLILWSNGLRKMIKIHWMLNYTPIKVTSNLMGMTGLMFVIMKQVILSNIQADGLFVAIGHQPNTDFLDGKLALDDKGYIQTQAGTVKTLCCGVFLQLVMCKIQNTNRPLLQQAVVPLLRLDTLAYIDNLR